MSNKKRRNRYQNSQSGSGQRPYAPDAGRGRTTEREEAAAAETSTENAAEKEDTEADSQAVEAEGGSQTANVENSSPAEDVSAPEEAPDDAGEDDSYEAVAAKKAQEAREEAERAEEEEPETKQGGNRFINGLKNLLHKLNVALHQKGPRGVITRVVFTVVVVCLLVFGLGWGFLTYEYNRLQKVDKDAYTDAKVIKTVQSDEGDTVLQASEKNMEEQLADVEQKKVVEAEGEIFRDSDVYNILLIGTDDRTKKFSSDARGDTCILLSVNKKTGKVSLISFERGIGVPVLWGPYEGQWDWLTHTFRYGGSDMMLQEIRDQFKVDVNRYIRINIRTLVKVIDCIGGVDVELTQAEVDNMNHPEGTFTAGYAKGAGVEDQVQEVQVGMNHLNGATAMVYSRLRYIDDDWHRIRRQRNVIMAGQKQLSSLNPAEMISTLDQVVPLIQTNLTEGEIANLLTLAPTFMSAEVDQMTVPAEGTYGSMKGMGGRSLYAVDFEANSELIRDQLYGSDAEEAAEGSSEAASEGADTNASGTAVNGTSGTGNAAGNTAAGAGSGRSSYAATQQNSNAGNAAIASTNGAAATGVAPADNGGQEGAAAQAPAAGADAGNGTGTDTGESLQGPGWDPNVTEDLNGQNGAAADQSGTPDADAAAAAAAQAQAAAAQAAAQQAAEAQAQAAQAAAAQAAAQQAAEAQAAAAAQQAQAGTGTYENTNQAGVVTVQP